MTTNVLAGRVAQADHCAAEQTPEQPAFAQANAVEPQPEDDDAHRPEGSRLLLDSGPHPGLTVLSERPGEHRIRQ